MEMHDIRTTPTAATDKDIDQMYAGIGTAKLSAFRTAGEILCYLQETLAFGILSMAPSGGDSIKFKCEFRSRQHSWQGEYVVSVEDLNYVERPRQFADTVAEHLQPPTPRT